MAPYWPWKQVLRDLLDVQSRSRVRTRDSLSIALAEIVPEAFPDLAIVPEQAPEQSRLHILDAATALVRSSSAERPLCIILDNLHCADGPSLELLEIIVREMIGWKVLILLAYREAALSTMGPTGETLNALAGEGLFHRIRLTGWNESGVQQYLRGYAGVEPALDLVRAIRQRTEGNPLFVAEVVRLLDHERLLAGESPDEGQAWEIHIPEKVRMAILGRVQRLGAPCRDFLSVAALAGREFDAALLQEVAPGNQPPVGELLEEALGSGLIEEAVGQAGAYRFTHALIQEAVETRLSPPRRAVLHLRIGVALEARYGARVDPHAGELAGHFDSAGPAASEKAVRYRQLAGQRALHMCGFEDAHQQFSRALAVGEGRASDRQTAELSFGLARAQHGLGEYKRAVENLGRAFDLFVQAGDLDRAFQVVEQPYLLTERRGLGEIHLLERALAIAGPDSPWADRLGFHYGLSLYHDTGNYDAACTIFQRALERTRQRGDRGMEKMTLANWAHVESDELHFQRSHEMAEHATRLAEEDGDYWVEATTRYTHWSALVGLGKLQDAEKEVRAIGQLGERLHSRYLICAGIYSSGGAMYRKGDLVGASEAFKKLMALGRSAFTTSCLIFLSAIEYHLGNRKDGDGFLEKTIEAWTSAEDPFHWAGWLAWAIVMFCWNTHYDLPLEAAEADAKKVLASRARLGRDAVNLSGSLGLIAVMRKDREAAARHYAELEPLRGLFAFPSPGVAADHLLATLARAKGDPRLAQEHFEAAVALDRASGARNDLAYTCCDYAELLLADGPLKDPDRARALCEESWKIAESAGMVPLMDRLKELRKTVDEHGQRAPPYPDSLSQREVDVLRLLAEGLGNEQIGNRLFISPHTVANHVQRILEKTGAANRTEAAVYAVRRGLAAHQRPPQ